MKRTYVKPIFAAESFQLDAAIAASCSSQGYTPIGYGENNCTYGDGVYFNYDNCDDDLVTGMGGDSNDTFCYHGPNDVGITFIAS